MKKIKNERKLTLDEEIVIPTSPHNKDILNKKRERMPEEEENKKYYFRKKIKTRQNFSVKKHNKDNNNKSIIKQNTHQESEEKNVNGYIHNLDNVFEQLANLSLGDNNNKIIKEKHLKENINTNNIINESLNLSKVNESNEEKAKETFNSNKDNNQIIFFRSLEGNTRAYKFIGRQKIDLILDIDQTLLFTRIDRSHNPDISTLDNKDNPDNIYSAKFQSNSNEKVSINYQIQLRKGLKSFLKAMSNYCNLYINTHSQENYAKEVVNIIANKSGIVIPSDHILASKSPQEIKLKTMGDFFTNDNFLILDDSLCAWESKYHNHIIPSMKYQGFFFKKRISQSEIYDNHYQYLLSNSSACELNEIESELFDENNVLYSMETDQSDKCQLDYLKSAIEKAYYLSFIYKKPIHLTFYYLRSLVFNKVRVCLCLEYELDLIKDIVIILGGVLVNETDQATHAVYNSNDKRHLESAIENNTNKDLNNKNNTSIDIQKLYNVNLKWLFHCYFYIEKMNENNKEYVL